MVSPPTTPGITSNPKYPFFNKLLQESQTSRKLTNQRQGRYPVCPATAPVLNGTSFESSASETLNMERKSQEIVSEKGQTREESADPPIKLLDPPKSKLKRQLSIDTVEKTDALRVRKRALLVESEDIRSRSDDRILKPDDDRLLRLADVSRTCDFGSRTDDQRSRSDEIDGGRASLSAEVIKIETSRERSPSQHEKRHVPSTTVTTSSSGQAIVPAIIYDKQDVQREFIDTNEYPNVPLQSPNRFNLSDIGLTSPFASRSQVGTNNKEKEVFVFPDSVPPRKLSPYKHVHEEYRGREISETGDEYSREMVNKFITESAYRKEASNETEQRHLHNDIRDTAHSKYSTTHTEPYRKSYVSEKGFAWPEKASITEPVPFSPRIVTTDSRPRFPSASTSNEKCQKSRDEDELKARLAVLEREYARAKEIYGSPPPVSHNYRQLSPTSRKVENLRRAALRSISNKDRSPNEKDIREISEEVRNRYERSFSDPRYSPRQLQGLLMRPSPLCRQHEEPVLDPLPHECYPERWREDVKRRLFVKGDVPHGSEYRRQHSSPYHQPARYASTEIPEEVLQFLHSRNFHPEELENLKDVLRRGGSPHGDEQSPYTRQPSLQFDEIRDVYNRYRQEVLSGRRETNFDEEYAWGVPRERQLGDIDIRLTCESIKERAKTDEILSELEHDDKDCRCAKIEQEIRLMAMDAYSKIRRADRSAEAHDQFQSELNETNANVYNSMRVLCGIKCLCKYGRTLDEVFTGSVVFRLNCPNVDALLDLWQLYKSGDLLRQLRDAFINEELLDKYGLEEINLKVSIDWQNYLDCKQELDSSLESSVIRTPTKSPLTPVHTRSRSEPASVSKQANQVLQPKTNLSPFRERFCSDSSVELSPRRAFQELNAGKHPVHPPSPSKKYFTDSVFTDEGSRSPLTSPRRKTFVLRPDKEQENVESSETCVV